LMGAALVGKECLSLSAPLQAANCTLGLYHRRRVILSSSRAGPMERGGDQEV
jgi:hypothetical protein